MKIGERGQVVIPKRVRRKYGLHPFTEVEFIEEKGGVRLIKAKTNTVEKMYGLLGKKGRTMDYLNEIRGK